MTVYAAVWFTLTFLFCYAGFPVAAAAITALVIDIIAMIVMYILSSIQGTKDANERLRPIAQQLATVSNSKITRYDFMQMEEDARSAVDKTLSRMGLTSTDFFNTGSSLGYIAFSDNRLFTNLTMRIESPNPRIGNLNPMHHFAVYSNSYENRMIIQDILSQIYSPRKHVDITCDDIDCVAQHIDVVTECLRCPLSVSIRILNKEDIAYFRVEGSSQYLTHISGGGINLDGAILGGAFAGDIGAIIGSKAGTEIHTQFVQKDNRRLFINYYENNTLISEEVHTDNIDLILNLLLKWMPEKDYNYVVAQKNRPAMENAKYHSAIPAADPYKSKQASHDSSLLEPDELEDLLKLGVISEEYYT